MLCEVDLFTEWRESGSVGNCCCYDHVVGIRCQRIRSEVKNVERRKISSNKGFRDVDASGSNCLDGS